MKTIAEIAHAIRLPRKLSFFDYEVPEEMEEKIGPGQIVEIPLRGRKETGVVLKVKKAGRPKFKGMKPVSGIREGLAVSEKQMELAKWMSEYYMSSLPLVFKAMLPAIPRKKSSRVSKKLDDFGNISCPALRVPKSSLLKIRKAVEAISGPNGRKFILACGDNREKTAVFLKAAERCAAKGRQVLIITAHSRAIAPIYSCLAGKFKSEISLLFSDLPKNAYLREWKRISAGEAKIIIGTRSATFAPASDLGLVIVDEEESWDHKQSDQNPRYDARKAAAKLAEIHEATVVLAGRAPSAEAFHAAKTGGWSLLDLGQGPSHTSSLADMNDEIIGKNFSPISNRLQEAIAGALSEKKKSVLFLNRKGTATLVACRDCGYVSKCPRCGLPFDCESSGEGQSLSLVCRHCGSKEPVFLSCPKCRGSNIRLSGTGLQKIEKELEKIFPSARIISISKDGGEKPKAGFDIAIGTRSLFGNEAVENAGNVGLIAMVSADSPLYRPDFRSAEKTFREITGVIDWALFGFLPDRPRLIIQTYSPEHRAIRSAATADYAGFYEKELQERQEFGYPPFSGLIKITARFPESEIEKQEKKMHRAAQAMEEALEGCEIIGPIAPSISKKGDFLILQIIAKGVSKKQKKILSGLVPDEWTVDVDPEAIL